MHHIPTSRVRSGFRAAHRGTTRVLGRSLTLAVTLLLCSGLPASAAGGAALASPADPSTGDLATDVGRATAWVVRISAVVATFYLTLGGARYMTAGSDPSEVERAKGALRAAGIGYTVCVLAPVILLVLKSILGVSS